MFTTDNQPENANNFSKDNQPTDEQRSKGQIKRATRKTMADDMFKKLLDMGTINETLEYINKNKDKELATEQLTKILRIITPKDVDITTDGDKIVMGGITVDGSGFSLDIGEKPDRGKE